MSTTAVYRAAEETTNDHDDEDNLVHRFCQCNDKIALCGKQKENWIEVIDYAAADGCIVCEHLHLARKCPKCSSKS